MRELTARDRHCAGIANRQNDSKMCSLSLPAYSTERCVYRYVAHHRSTGLGSAVSGYLMPSARRVFCAVKCIELMLCRARLFLPLMWCETWEGVVFGCSQGPMVIFGLGTQLGMGSFSWASAL